MFAVFADDVEHTNKVLNGTDFEYTLTEDCAKVSVVGSAMRGVPGVMANFVAALPYRLQNKHPADCGF